jgi:CBS domain-containing protein
MKIRDVMNREPTRVRLTDSLKHAAQVLASSQASDVMVVDGQDNFVGVLSEGDLIRVAMPSYEEILREGGDLTDAFEVFVDKGRDLAGTTVERLVIKQPLSVTPNEELLKAAGTMVRKQIRRLPVVEGNRLVGTISRADVCRAVLGG